MTLFLIAAGAVLLISLVIIIPNLLIGRSKNAQGYGIPLGNPQASVTVINFSSYACGHCENFSKTIEPNLIADYVEPGNVHYRYVNIAHSDAGSRNAAKASYCAADQNRFFDYKSYLYSAVSVQDGFSDSNLIDLAGAAGLDRDLFEACFEDSKYDNAYAEDLRFAQSVGVTGTPSFLVNGQLVFSSELIPLVDSLLNN